MEWVWAALAALLVLWIARRLRRKRTRLDRHYPSWVAGLRHPAPDGTDRGVYCKRIKIGDEIKLVREPKNPHDRNAVALFHGKVHIGHIPKKHRWVGKAIDESRHIGAVARTIEIEDGRAAFVGIEIGIAETE